MVRSCGDHAQVDALKWAAAKLLPRKYGDKLDVSAEINVAHDLSQRLADALARVKRPDGDHVVIEHDPDPDCCTA